MKNMVQVFCCATFAVLMMGGSAAAQDNESAGNRTVRDSVYTLEQAERGQQLAQQECMICHTTSEWTTPTFLRMWQDRSILELYDMIRLTMPYDLPGRFSREEYADIMAFILRLNDLPDGPEPLPSEAEKLDNIIVTAEEEAP